MKPLALLILCLLIRAGRVYRDRPAWYCYSKVLGVQTNRVTHLFWKELESLWQPGYAVIPDCPAWWIFKKNPLPSDWPQATELCNDRLFQRVVGALPDTILVAKVKAEKLWLGWADVDNRLVRHVRNTYMLIDETFFWEVRVK